MQEIRLVEMRIRNFKGIRELDINFNGGDMKVLGDNGTGKTSIIDSFTWLLFGKDSLNRADFGIKPTDSEGNIIHQLETSVEAIFDISGTEKAFKKTLSEVWTRKRGAAEAEFTRNENNFYIDGVPKKKTEYTAAINELIDEDVFKIITNPLYFNESVNWKDRRRVLLAICGDVSDEDVIAAKAELAPLLPLLQGKSVQDFKEITASGMKRVNQELDMIPVKIAEAERAKPSAAALEVDQARKEALTQEIEALRIKHSNIRNGAEVANERQKIEWLRQQLQSIGEVNIEWTNEAAEVNRLQQEIHSDEYIINSTEYTRNNLVRRIEEEKAKRIKYSEAWDNVMAVQFKDSICPTCHRELPEDEVEERRNNFNASKARKLDEIEHRNEDSRIAIESLEKKLAEFDETYTGIRDRLESARVKLSEAVKAKDEIAKLYEERNAAKREQIEADIAASEAKIRTYNENTEAAVAEIEQQIVALSGELSTINEAIANKALIERQDKRIAELKEQQKLLVTEYTKLERSLYLSEQFIIAKVDMLNDLINAKFKHANFKLFNRQINGGIEEVCEVTYNGIPYKDLNNAMKINIGLDVINTITDFYGVAMPILIDNAESVNSIYPTKAQQIRFYVSTDKKLIFN